MHWIPVGASIFASNIGSGHFIGLAGFGAASGIGVSVFELNAVFALILLGWVFVPVYMSAGVFTMPEYLNRRFGGQRIRIYLAVLALLLSVFTKISADLYAGAVFIERSLGWNLYVSVILLLGIAALFTIAGGLTAVIWTNFVETCIMVIGAASLLIMGVVKVGSFSTISQRFMQAAPNTTIFEQYHSSQNQTSSYLQCGYPPKNSLHLIRSADDSQLPWPGVFFGLTVTSIWYWCTDQVIVQRALAAKSLTHAKAGTILTGFLKILPMWLLVVPGMIARILFPDTVACADPESCMAACGQKNGCTNIAYPTLVLELMPTGARGLMLAVMMAALMSSLTSVFNSSSTLFTMDIWLKIRSKASQIELMIVGRLFVLFMVGIGIAWIPIVKNFSELFNYIQTVQSFLSPPICAVYLLAILWKRINEKGAFCGLVIGLLIGLVRFIWEYSYEKPICGEVDERPAIIKNFHYLHFGMLLFAIVCIITTVVSLLTEPIDENKLHRLTFWTRYSTEENKDDFEDNTKFDAPARESVDDEVIPWYTKGLQWICGIEKQKAPSVNDEELNSAKSKSGSLDESPFWKKMCNIGAGALLVMSAFIWGFFR
ncbi:DgyrCDS12944 [Dimorphilus gyrociliatus]|uniref:DgyrCDS12944 n=1 Tax=Dimorphilus gyrociliatus TaxID=2664684 RepID=A0A7I8W984_9ANNE|nr:DgyrCDS12944 [Dimorphilus gyrociliatus]